MPERESPSPAGGPRRADARDNRARIMAAATEIFAEQGVDVQMSDVARRARVSIGTLYRNFPTKEGLVDTLLLQRLHTVTRAARHAAARETDAWASLEAFLRAIAGLQVGDRSLSQYIGGRIPGSSEARKLLEDLFVDFSAIVERAQQAGQLRGDVEASDIRVAMICVARAVWSDWPDADWVQQRFLGLLLEGLRAPGHATLPGTPMPRTGVVDIGERRQAPAFRRGRRSWDTP